MQRKIHRVFKVERKLKCLQIEACLFAALACFPEQQGVSDRQASHSVYMTVYIIKVCDEVVVCRATLNQAEEMYTINVYSSWDQRNRLCFFGFTHTDTHGAGLNLTEIQIGIKQVHTNTHTYACSNTLNRRNYTTAWEREQEKEEKTYNSFCSPSSSFWLPHLC